MAVLNVCLCDIKNCVSWNVPRLVSDTLEVVYRPDRTGAEADYTFIPGALKADIIFLFMFKSVSIIQNNMFGASSDPSSFLNLKSASTFFQFLLNQKHKQEEWCDCCIFEERIVTEYFKTFSPHSCCLHGDQTVLSRVAGHIGAACFVHSVIIL